MFEIGRERFGGEMTVWEWLRVDLSQRAQRLERGGHGD
jgi:hypothetical protein